MSNKAYRRNDVHFSLAYTYNTRLCTTCFIFISALSSFHSLGLSHSHSFISNCYAKTMLTIMPIQSILLFFLAYLHNPIPLPFIPRHPDSSNSTPVPRVTKDKTKVISLTALCVLCEVPSWTYSNNPFSSSHHILHYIFPYNLNFI